MYYISSKLTCQYFFHFGFIAGLSALFDMFISIDMFPSCHSVRDVFEPQRNQGLRSSIRRPNCAKRSCVSSNSIPDFPNRSPWHKIPTNCRSERQIQGLTAVARPHRPRRPARPWYPAYPEQTQEVLQTSGARLLPSRMSASNSAARPFGAA